MTAAAPADPTVSPPAPTTLPVLQLIDVQRTFGSGEGAVHALRGVSLNIHAGEFVAIMGPSGSGKSTLLHLAGGLDLPTAGEVRVEGQALSPMGDRKRTLFRRRRISVIFQSFNLLPTLTARENVALPLLIDAQPARQAYAAADSMIERVHITHRAAHRPDAMSGGEQQRVAIARALCNDPALILADEPTGNLDTHNAVEIWRLLRNLCTDGGRTVLMITHEAAGAAFADRVMVLRDGNIRGEILASGSADAQMVAARYAELAA
mgnify:CR=1 FL=1